MPRKDEERDMEQEQDAEDQAPASEVHPPVGIGPWNGCWVGDPWCPCTAETPPCRPGG